MASIAMATVVWPVFSVTAPADRPSRTPLKFFCPLIGFQGSDFRPMPAEALEIRFP